MKPEADVNCGGRPRPGLRACLFALVACILAGPAAAYVPWQDQKTVEGVVYFAMPYPTRVERFDMAQEAWLTPIATLDQASAIAVGGGYLVTVEQDLIRRYPLGGGEPVLLAERPSPAELLLRDDVVIVRHGSWYTGALETLDLGNGNPIDTLVLGLSVPSGLAMPREQQSLYGITDGSYPGKLVRVDVTTDGLFLGHETGPHADLHPRPERHYVAPDGSSILTSGGQVVDGTSLASGLGSGGPLITAVIEDGFALVLREQALARLDAQFRELGVWQLDQRHDGVAAYGDKAFVFRDDWPGHPQVTARVLTTITPLKPPVPPNPRDRQWLADEIELDQFGIVHLHERARSAVHRFSLEERVFLESLPLTREALHLAVVPETGAVLIANDDGRLGQAERNDRQTHFVAYAPADVRFMAAAGQWIHTDIESGSSFTTHQLFNTDGERLAVLGTQRRALAMRWCPQTRRLYYATAFVSPSSVRWVGYSESGEVLDQGMLPYGSNEPLRPSADGTRLVGGSGHVLDTQSGALLATLPGPFIDMAWVGSELYTLRLEEDQSVVERWSQDLDLIKSGVIFGTAQRLLADGDRLIGVAVQNGQTWIYRVSPDLTNPNLSAWLELDQSEFVPGQDVSAEAIFVHGGAGGAVPAEITVNLTEQAFTTYSWHCEDSSGPFDCGQDGDLIESLTLMPGDWVSAELSGTLAPDWRGTITLRAEVLPATPDFDTTDNVDEHVLNLADVVFSDRFDTETRDTLSALGDVRGTD